MVTGFSGTKPAVPPAAAGDALDEIFIDVDGASARILRLEPAAPPTGQLIATPPVLSVQARDIGQVFAIALDDGLPAAAAPGTPNVYLGATSAFGLQIVAPDSNGDGRPERLKKGQANAEWMAGQWGSGGEPGSIYRIDGKTGAASRFATIHGNRGPGLGDIVFDKATRQFFVSDLDTGLIHRLDATGRLVDSFDHGQTGRPAMGLPAIADDGVVMDITSPTFDAEDSASWGFTQAERRVWGLGLRAGRLYYASAAGAAGPEIWSVAINLDGTFGSDPRREIEVSGTPDNHPISDIAFDAQDHMYVAQRGGIKGSYDYSAFADVKQSVVFRFMREIPDDPVTPGIWVPIPDEYAVGFPPDHRNTSGGVALGYGYDQAGAMRPGACDMTVWATGDALLSNASPTQDAATQQSPIVDGLQGNDRALTRPDNEPPAKSYFIDYDGVTDDMRQQGHVGDVEIWQPCEPGAAFGTYSPAADLPPDYVPPGGTDDGVPPDYVPPDDGVPPDDTPDWTYNLRLEKRPVPNACVAGGLGFLCDYVVRVTNTGPDAYIGPIVVNDALPAAPAGAVMTPANIPPWLCFAISPSEQQCTYGPAALLPGESIDLHVAVDLPVAAPVCHLDNQAELVWPWGFGDIDPTDDFDLATATIPAPHCPPPDGEKTNLKISKHPLADVCTEKFGSFECRYNVVVRNIGAGVYNGIIKVDDTVPAGATATFPQASWNCVGPAPTYSCQRGPVVLLPNQAVNLNVIVKLPKNLAGPLQCQAKNEVKITAAAGGTDQNTDATDDEADATMLLPGELALCPNLDAMSNLKLKKTGPAGECPVIFGNWICEFKVTVQNFGKAYTSPIQFIDALPFGNPAGAAITFQPPAGWSCGGPVLFPNLYQCSSNNPDLAHMEKVEIPAIVKIPVAPVAKCEVTNNAQIVKAPGGTLLNSFAGDDASSAKAKLAAAAGQGICLSNLKLTKTGPAAPCPVSGGNWECKFKVTVQNFGKDYTSPIQFVDALPFGGPAGATLSFQPPAGWYCGG
ncbi:MAG: YncE family protein, partial [Parvibaculaceae bacterium]